MKRNRLFSLIICCAILSCLLFGGCSPKVDVIDLGVFSVHFFDTYGDVTFIKLPDGKCLLIDTGEDDEKEYGNTKRYLDKLGTSTIDYLIITCPISECYGNVDKLIKDYKIKKVYIPDIRNYAYFEKYEAVKNSLTSVAEETEYTSTFKTIVGQDYYLCFLYPEEYGTLDSPYNQIVVSTPTEREIKNCSPIVFFTCFDKKFVISSFEDEDADKTVADLATVNLYAQFSQKIDLSGIDVYKVSNHGLYSHVNEKLLKICKPTYSVITCQTAFGKSPKSSLFNSLAEYGGNTLFVRTDVLGTLSFIYKNEELTLKTEI